jgi:AraC-like DNA-binding protein
MTSVCSSTTATPYGGEVAKPYWQTLVDTCQTLGFSGEGVVTDEADPVSVEQYLALFEKGVCQREGFGLNVGQSVTLRTYPILGMTLLVCQTLKQILEQIVRYESLNHDLGVSKLIIGEDESQYIWTPNSFYVPNSKSSLSFQLVVSVFAGIQTFSPWLLGEKAPVEIIGFMASKPENSQAYQDFFNVEILYNQAYNFICIKNEVLGMKLANADITSFSALTSHADSLLLSRETKKSIIWQLKKILPDALRHQSFRIEDLASQMNISTRTLQRKLKDAGTGFQSVLDEVRRHLAEFYLMENQLSMSEIAFIIGYQEQSSFNHAFKVWNGLSPTDYRNRKIE